MFERIDFYQWRCVRTVIEVVEQVPGRWLARGSMRLDESSVALLILWSWLRWENDFLTGCLEELGVDLASLTHQVDDLLTERILPKDSPLAVECSPKNPQALCRLNELITSWLDRAADEAFSLHQNYLGVEHLLLAFLRLKDGPLPSLFSQYCLDHDRLSSAVLEAIAYRQANREEPAEVQAFDLETAAEPKHRPNNPPVGMPKRFSMAILMSWVTLFAMVFSLLQAIGTSPLIFGIIAVLMFCVGLGQMWLFEGKHPRAASIWTGAVVLSAEVFILNVAIGCFSPPSANLLVRIIQSVFYIIVCIPLGAFFGYLAGGLTAGIVLLLDYLEKRSAAKRSSEDAEEGSDANATE